jgi:protein-tyrosine phosphatase
MDFVEPGLAVCGLREALKVGELQTRGIQAVLQLYTAPIERLTLPASCEALHLQVRDREPLPPEALVSGLEFISRHRAEGRTVLVVCGAGTSRSVTFVAGQLYREGHSLSEAFGKIAG